MSPSSPSSTLLVGEAGSPALAAAEQALRASGLEPRLLPAHESELAAALTSPGLLVVLVEPTPSGGRTLIDTVRRQPASRLSPILVLAGAPQGGADLGWLSVGADLQAPSPAPAPVLAAVLAAAERLRERASQTASLEQRLRLAETTDPLTGLANHRQFHDRLHEEFLRCERYAKPLSLMFADLDDFRSVNSTYGHQVGDGFLRGVASFLASAVRKVDLVARYEGEQFAFILPETDAGRARQAAERLRSLAAGYIYKEAGGKGAYHALIKTTLSFGVATHPHSEIRNRHDLVQRAEEALREAQQAGRNRVCQHSAR
jgi:diguanylate cyclase (GGDEF)-like protein